MPTLSEIQDQHRSGERRPSETIRQTYAAIRAHDDPALFIALKPEGEALAEAAALEAAGPEGRPLWGVPVAIKDNIDVQGLATTAACPAFAYQPARDAGVVARLIAAGAVVVGKTNLDQFATGLVGVRSPYGVPRNALRRDLVPGGSSSGSASAVSAGLVPLALGTDTAGSGRVPAGLQNIVGLKPSLGLVSTAGVVPACRTLDCVSVFALTVDDAWTALAAIAGPDAADPFSRMRPLGHPGALPPGLRVGLPGPSDLDFDGDAAAAEAFETAVRLVERLGCLVVEIDFAPFREAARLLYEGPWVAERWLVVRDLLDRDPDTIHPVTREVIAGRPLPTAADAFAARYRLAELAQASARALAEIDVLMVPTAPRPVTLEEIARAPVQLNSLLGRYTNFVNLLDLCGLAVPAAVGVDGTAHGVTFLAAGGRDAVVATLGRVFHAATALPLGATRRAQPAPGAALATTPPDQVALAVVGAHLSGMALNHQLVECGASFVRTAVTSADYRLFALPGSPARPGLLRVEAGRGTAIAVEIWAMPADGFGRFVAAIPPPLGIATLRLEDGGAVQGFVVEAEATREAEDISRFGGWRAYRAAANAAA